MKEFHKSKRIHNSTPYASKSDLGYFITNSDVRPLNCHCYGELASVGGWVLVKFRASGLGTSNSRALNKLALKSRSECQIRGKEYVDQYELLGLDHMACTGTYQLRF